MAECGHCRDCRWWLISARHEGSQWASCIRFLVKNRVPAIPGSLAMAKLPLETAGAFGCVMFEPRKGENG